MSDGFYIVEYHGRRFEVCVRGEAGEPIYIRADDSLPIPWEELSGRNRKGNWVAARLVPLLGKQAEVYLGPSEESINRELLEAGEEVDEQE